MTSWLGKTMGDDHYTISGVVIGGRNNTYGESEGRSVKPKPWKNEEVDQSKQTKLFKWLRPTKSKKGGAGGGGYDHPPGAVSFAYSFTPYQVQYPPPPPYQYPPPPQMAAGAGHGYYEGHHGPGYYPGQIPPNSQGVYNSADAAATGAHRSNGLPGIGAAFPGAAANDQHGGVVNRHVPF